MVMASKVECFPNSILEAMYFGLPIITTDSPGGCQEIVGKKENTNKVNSIMLCKYGILTPVMPSEKLKMNMPLAEQEITLGEAMFKVLTDNELHEKYKKQSLKRAECYSIKKVVKNGSELQIVDSRTFQISKEGRKNQ